jgi:DNA helicase-2/ATP-dependent DNA helicase PcrA
MTSRPIGRGHLALGRSVIVAPGQAPPDEWADIARVPLAVTAAALTARTADDPSLTTIHSAWVERRAVVFEVDPATDVRQAASLHVGHHWELGVASEPPGERARFALSANVVDIRSGRHEWALLDAALAAGARVGGPADVVDEQGRALWLDGGPLQWFDDIGGAVVPRVHLVRRSLRPLGLLPALPAELASDQAAAVGHARGTARIIAPAGSGKTRVLTERVRRLVGGGLAPGAVTLVAYNTRAQAEMQQRLDDVPGLEVRTLHALARRIVVSTDRGRSTEVIDERRVRRILADLVPPGPRRANTDPLESWVDAVTWARDTLSAPDAVLAAFPDLVAATGGDPTVVERVITDYRRRLADAGVVDFPEMVLGAITALLEDPGLRDRVRAGVGTLAVDEFQDLTPALMLLVRLLAGPAQEVFAVGDDDQTVYGFSGADPRWLVDFSRWFPGATGHALEVNYRCPTDVVASADRLLRRNRVRVDKVIRPAPLRSDTGLAIHVADDPTAMNRRLVDLIRSRLAGGEGEPASIAVLARTNSVLLAPYLFLTDAGVPVATPAGVGPDLLDRSGVAALLAWVDVAVSGADRFDPEALAVALTRPATSLPPRVTEAVQRMRDVSSLRRFADGSTSERIRQSLDRFTADVERVVTLAARGADTATIVGAVLDEIGLGRSADGLDDSQRAARRATHRDQLDALRSVAALEPDPTRFRSFLSSSLATVGRHRDGVTLATVHTVKGQEWDHVHVVDASAAMFPHRLAESVEEERRVFHVAITRGRRSVTVHTDRERGPSPFVAELTEEPGATAAVATARPARPTTAPRQRSARAGGASAPVDEGSPLRVALVEWRRRTAAGKPAYTVMNNAVIDEIVRRRPRDASSLGAVPGIGPHKLAAYGDEILALVAEHPDG